MQSYEDVESYVAKFLPSGAKLFGDELAACNKHGNPPLPDCIPAS
jgi:hypothetical protein